MRVKSSKYRELFRKIVKLNHYFKIDIGRLSFVQQFLILNMNTNDKYCLLFLSSLSIAFNTAIAVNAADVKTQKQLFFPLNISQSSTVYLSKSNHNSSNDGSREYTFKAPDSKTLTNNNQQLTAVQDYRVEVYGSAEEILVQVKDIEPGAFINGNIIQVGIFSQQSNAEDLVRKLAAAGLWARIVAQ